ncbi:MULTISPECIES: hypothetical protein [unclassified Sphingomonas]|uniref:hypothetical protein n=1 Tax=unclassified Sphingomonas TaxID=196159 RepID=UPI00226AE583|nr:MULTISPECIES: hypothetical protein [unclassified Sphingomonas]
MDFPLARNAARAFARGAEASFQAKLSRALSFYPPATKDQRLLVFSTRPLSSCEFLPLANAEVRLAAAFSLIDSFLDHYGSTRKVSDSHTYLATFTWDAGLTFADAPQVNLEAMERTVRRQLERLGLNAVCSFEIDVFADPLAGEHARRLHFHVHAVCWTRDRSFRPVSAARALRRGKAFPSLLGAPSVSFVSRSASAAQYPGFERPQPRQDQTASSMAHLGYYLLKATSSAKHRFLGRDGTARMRGDDSAFNLKTALRFAEIYSQITPADAIFAVGAEAAAVAANYNARLRRWVMRQGSRGHGYTEAGLQAAWARLFDAHPELGLHPSAIRQRRHTLADAGNLRRANRQRCPLINHEEPSDTTSPCATRDISYQM